MKAAPVFLQSGNTFALAEVAGSHVSSLGEGGFPSRCEGGESVVIRRLVVEKMPAILVASKMKSGLPKPKPVHSALPIPQTHSRPSALALPVKTQVPPLGKQVGSGPPRSVTPGSEAGGNPQVRISNSSTTTLLCFLSIEVLILSTAALGVGSLQTEGKQYVR